jgi:hypothetical protein
LKPVTSLRPSLRAKKPIVVVDDSLRRIEAVSVEVGEPLEAMPAVKSRLVAWEWSGCTDLIAAHLSWLDPEVCCMKPIG